MLLLVLGVLGRRLKALVLLVLLLLHSGILRRGLQFLRRHCHPHSTQRHTATQAGCCAVGWRAQGHTEPLNST